MFSCNTVCTMDPSFIFKPWLSRELLVSIGSRGCPLCNNSCGSLTALPRAHISIFRGSHVDSSGLTLCAFYIKSKFMFQLVYSPSRCEFIMDIILLFNLSVCSLQFGFLELVLVFLISRIYIISEKKLTFIGSTLLRMNSRGVVTTTYDFIRDQLCTNNRSLFSNRKNLDLMC